jgi:ketosteroid isomerase-like protein
MHTFRTLLFSVLSAAALGVSSLASAQSSPLPYTLQLERGIPSITTVQQRDEAVRLFSAHLALWTASNPKEYPYADLLTDDAVYEYPYANDDSGLRVEGRNSVATIVRDLPGAAIDWQFRDVKLFETPHPDVFFVEYRANAYVPATHRLYEGRHIARVTVRDSHIADYLEVWDRAARDLAFGQDSKAKVASLR